MYIGCNKVDTSVDDNVDAPTTVTPVNVEQETVAIVMETTPQPTAIPTPTPTPTPDPTPVPPPTPIPFSYYAPTVNMTFEELVGGSADCYYDDDEIWWPTAYPAPDTYKILVDLEWQVVTIFTKDDNGEYTVPVRYMLCSTGSRKLGETRVGTFPMKKCRIRYGEFINGDAAQYWTLIYSRTYFHSVLYVKKDLNTYDLEAYNSLGTKVSHGCIRLTVPDARWLWYNIGYGTECEIRKGSKDDIQMQAIREQLVLPPAPAGRIELQAGAAPWTDNWTLEGLENLTLPFENEAPNRPSSSSSSGSSSNESTATPKPSGDSGSNVIPILP